ncbi:MAG: hypothetical protein HMLKMBBP_02869 [Planctomycetes bacterium]|nr:hypothetical protein [Planctomycetota bacterium]
MRFARKSAIAAAATALVAGSAYLVVTSDAFVKRMVRSLLAQTVRGPATVESATFGFLDGLEVRGVEVRDPYAPQAAPVLRVETVRADYGLFALGGGPRVTAVRLENPEVRLRRGPGGELTVASLVQLPQSEGGAPPPAIDVAGGRVVYEDAELVRGEPFVLRAVRLSLRDAGDGSISASGAGKSDELGDVTIGANLRPDGGAEVHAQCGKVDVGRRLASRVNLPAARVVEDLAPQGSAGFSVDVEFAAGKPPELRIGLDLRDVVLSATAPGSRPGDAPPAPVEIRIVRGRAVLRGSEIALEGLEAHALGAEITASGALRGLDGAAEVDVRADLKGLSVGDRLAPFSPAAVRDILAAYGIRGTLDAHGTLRGPLERPVVVAEAMISGGRACYEGRGAAFDEPGFPWEVTHLDAAVSWDGSRFVRIVGSGRHGASPVKVNGHLDYAAGEEIPEIEIVAEDVPLDADLKAGFRDGGDAFFAQWGPSGTARRVTVRVIRDPHTDGTHGAATDIDVELDGRANFRPSLFPAEVRSVSGRVTVSAADAVSRRREVVRLRDVRGLGDGFTIAVDGSVDTDRDGSREDIDVRAEVSDFARAFRDALLAPSSRVPPDVKRIVGELRPAGAAAVHVQLAGSPDRRSDRVAAELRGLSVERLPALPLALSGVTGRLGVDGDELRFGDLRGRLLDTEFAADGRLLGLSSEIDTDFRVTAPHLPLGEPLRRALGALAERASGVWDHLRPVGGDGVLGTRADAVVVLAPRGSETPLHVTLDRIRGPLLPLGLEFDCTGGSLVFDGRTAEIRDLDASIGAATVVVKRAVYDLAEGSLRASARMKSLRFPEDVESLLSAAAAERIRAAMPRRNLDTGGLSIEWNDALRTLSWHGQLDVRPRGEDPPDEDPGFAPAGTVAMRECRIAMPAAGPATFAADLLFDRFRMIAGVPVDEYTGVLLVEGALPHDGARMTLSAKTPPDDRSVVRAAGYTFSDATVDLGLRNEGVRLEFASRLCGGDFTARLVPGGPNVAFAGSLALRRADLSQMTGSGDVKGTVTAADVTFRNPTGRAEDLVGRVEASVSDGDLVRFPVISAILNLIPGAGKLDQGRLVGDIAGRTVRLRELTITGPVLAIETPNDRGAGWVTFDGRTDLVLQPTTRGGIPLLGPLWSATLGTLYRVRVTGTLREPVVGAAPGASASEGPGDASAPAPSVPVVPDTPDAPDASEDAE